MAKRTARLAHLVDELADRLLSVPGVTALDVADELLGAPAAQGVGQLERPEEGRGLLEVGSAGGDLVDEVLDACGLKALERVGRETMGGGRTDDALLAELLLDDRVVGDRDSLTVELGVSSLVDQFLDGLQVGFTMG
jgi:hypothetical protein